MFSYCYDYNLNDYHYEYIGRNVEYGNDGLCPATMWDDCTFDYLKDHPNLWCTCWLFYDCPNRN